MDIARGSHRQRRVPPGFKVNLLQFSKIAAAFFSIGRSIIHDGLSARLSPRGAYPMVSQRLPLLLMRVRIGHVNGFDVI